MSEYITRERALEILNDIGGCGAEPGSYTAGWDEAINAAYEAIQDEPAADVAPVVHGEWHYNENGRDFGLGAWACSCCGTCNHNIPGNPNMNPYIWSGSKFCPNCGAKMDGTIS